MALFLEIVLGFPTVLFTIALCLCAAYWMLVVLGALDIEALDVADGVVDGALDGIDGAFDAVEGALDAADGTVDAAADGAAEGAAADVGSGASPLVVLANVFRLGRVPLTVSLTAFTFWGWIIGFVLTWLYLGSPTLVPHLAFSVVTLVGSAAGAAALTNLTVRPLEPVFHLHGARTRGSLVGEVCEITTGRVGDSFGQGTLLMGGDDLLFQVRCDKPNPLRKGDSALIVSYDPVRQAYVVEPMVHATPPVDVPVELPLPNPALVNKEA